MKKSILLVTLCFSICNSFYSQTYNEYYFGEDVYLYKNALIKLNSEKAISLNYMFYGALKDCQELFNNNVLYPDKQYAFSTDKEKLTNKIFSVEQILNKEGKEFVGKASKYNAPILLLKDTTSKELIYFKYDTKNTTINFYFPFLTSVNINKDYFCNKLESKKDDFTGETKIQNPISLTTKEYIYKNINQSDTSYYLSFETTGVGEPIVDGKGVIILFENGSKLEKPNEVIDVKVGQKDYVYSCFIRLTKQDLELLRKNNISKYRLYIFDAKLSQYESIRLQNYIDCIISK